MALAQHLAATLACDEAGGGGGAETKTLIKNARNEPRNPHPREKGSSTTRIQAPSHKHTFVSSRDRPLKPGVAVTVSHRGGLQESVEPPPGGRGGEKGNGCAAAPAAAQALAPAA